MPLEVANGPRSLLPEALEVLKSKFSLLQEPLGAQKVKIHDFKRHLEQKTTKAMDKEDLMIDIHQAAKNGREVVMMVSGGEDDGFSVWRTGDGTEAVAVLKAFLKMPFKGRIKPNEAFDDWEDYVPDTDSAEIYGFSLEDGEVQICITGYVTATAP